MKRVKLMLSAIAVLAVAGGAFAFKAKTPNFHLYKSINNTCSILDPQNVWFPDPNGDPIEYATITNHNIQGSATTGLCDFTIRIAVE